MTPRTLKDSVIAYLRDHDLTAAQSENIWLAFTLRFHGETLRRALAADDPHVADRLLATIPAAHNLFQERT